MDKDDQSSSSSEGEKKRGRKDEKEGAPKLATEKGGPPRILKRPKFGGGKVVVAEKGVEGNSGGGDNDDQTRQAPAPVVAAPLVPEPHFPVPLAVDGPGVAQMPAMANIPRQWQMTNFEAQVCIFDLAMWKERFASFKALPIPASVEKLKQLPDLEARLKELAYLSDELYSIWGNGCTATPHNRPTAIQEKIVALREKDQLIPRDGPIKSDPMAIAFCIFFNSVKKVELSPHLVETHYNKVHGEVLELIQLHKAYKFDSDESTPACESLSKVLSTQLAVINAYRMLQHAAALSIAIDPAKSAISTSQRVLYFVESLKEFHSHMDDAKPLAKFLMFLIEAAHQKRYRRYRECVYRELYTEDGYATSFWEKVSTIQQFIGKESDRLGANKMWHLSLERGNLKNAEDYLNTFHDDAFPIIKIDRHVFSFKNGIYFAATRKFRPYKEGKIDWGRDTRVDRCQDIDRSRPLYLSENVFTNASANYFDVDFVDYERVPNFSWWDIPTPTLSTIFNDQDIPIDAQKVAFAMIGRLLYDTGEMDKWEVILWILGRAGTGKSTLCKIAQLFYQQDDVAILSNNIEEQFGLGGVYDKLIFAASEVKRDFRLSQAEFQMMVSGEKMSIARKFKTAANVLFTVPGIIAGNDMPAWMDNSNSVVRRVVLLMFNKPLKKVDQSIAGKLRNEIAAILSKCNQAYHIMVRTCGDEGLWSKMPMYFKTSQNQLKAKTHPVYHFLQSEDLIFSTNDEEKNDVYMPLDVFRTMFLLHCQKCSLKRVPWNEELYQVPLADRGLDLDYVAECVWPPGSTDVYKNCTIIKGVTSKDGRPGQAMQANPYRQGSGPSPSKPDGGPSVTGASAGAAKFPAKSVFSTYKAIPTIK